MNIRSWMVAALVLAPALASAQQAQHELLVFPSVQVVRPSGLAAANEDLDDELFSADVLLSLQEGRFRLFGEYLLTNHESDLERLQLGWEASEDTTLWLGRFHQASSVWNHEHHHGQFLQTSITRPVIENWEDDGGIIPQHFLGVLVESNWHLGGGKGLSTAIGGGLAPLLTHDGLEPFDFIHPDTSKHQLGFQARVSFLPDELGESAAGLLIAHNEINWEDVPPPQFAAVTHVDQTVVGAFGHLMSEPWMLSAVLYYVKAEMVGASSSSGKDDFFTGYVQAEHDLRQDVTFFARFEDTSNPDDVPYLSLFPDFVTQRAAIGVRWAIARRHAVSLEISDSQTTSDHFEEFRLQWSAALF